MPPTTETDKDADLRAAQASAADAERNADTIAKEAKFQAEAAKLMAQRADAYAKERKAEERIEALASRKDSVQKGSVDLMPELKLPDADLVKKVRAGECDGCLSELLELAIAHPRPGKEPGQLRERVGPIEALKARGAKEPKPRE
jgi:hypothetical protein